ncbi:3'-5' exonuclease [Thalassotalea sp. 1_MG-2023]|uniref:3'-5' exonuclease n=1 Tax=Thalassotalea sp. 1_MG-2023 TaxID=3062680 RepID=UPI0026E1B1DC|nr:3'-5' exonuclease [Thalassotalea sp. 1_MG-2023]MDO6427673.1 3'-5' exonuclease [Thalassotalea sp. 1_MG-2023]
MGIECNDMTLDVMRQSYDIMMIVDIEHTCSHDGSIPPDEREIIEIGAVVVDMKSLEIIDEYCALIRPQRHPLVSDFCTQITGITQSELDNSDDFKTVFSDFLHWYPKTSKVLFATWGSYDLVQINIDCAFHNLQHFSPDAVLNLKKTFKKVNKLKKPVGLARALELCQCEYNGSRHRALDDARNTVQLLPFIFSNIKPF